MCGDRLDTDVLFGKNGGLTTMLVLSGESLWGPGGLQALRGGTAGGEWSGRPQRCRNSIRLPSQHATTCPYCLAHLSSCCRPTTPSSPISPAATSHLPPSHLRLSLRLAGVTTEEQLLSPDNSIHPDAYMDSLAGLLEVKPVTA